MSSSSRPELVIPVQDAEESFWKNIIKSKEEPTPTAPAAPNPYAMPTPDANGNFDPESFQDPVKQHEMVDSIRSTDNIDYNQVRMEANGLVELRKELEKKKRMSDFRKIGKERYPFFVGKFPRFFDSIRTCEYHRLNEFVGVMEMLLTQLCKVKDSAMTHTEMRNQVFEKDLAAKYYRRKRT